jgi:hypothetical protein
MILVEVTKHRVSLGTIEYYGLRVTTPNGGMKFNPEEKRGVIVKPDNVVPEHVIEKIASMLEIGKGTGDVNGYRWAKGGF